MLKSALLRRPATSPKASSPLVALPVDANTGCLGGLCPRNETLVVVTVPKQVILTSVKCLKSLPLRPNAEGLLFEGMTGSGGRGQGRAERAS